jgi:hypothetical protein
VPESIKLVWGSCEGMLEFAHSSARSIQRDIEDEHVGTLGLTDVIAAKTQQFR